MKKTLILSTLSIMMLISSANAQQQQSITVNAGRQISVNSAVPVQKKVLAQSVMEFMYDYYYLPDTTDVSNRVEDLMILQVGYGVSKFSSYRAMQVDSLIAVSSAQQIMDDPGRYVGGESWAVYKNHPAGRFTNTDKIATDWFLYEEDIPVQEWTLREGVKEIEGYKCREASCRFRGRDYTAWYTDEIAVADGPWKFGGLPGFIMEVMDDRGHYGFRLVGINSNAQRDITITDVQYNKTSIDKFYATKRKYDTDPIGYMSAVSGVNVTITTPDGKPRKDAMMPRELKYSYIELDYK